MTALAVGILPRRRRQDKRTAAQKRLSWQEGPASRPRPRSSFLGAAPGLPAAVAQNAASASLVLRHRQFAPDGSDKGHSKIQAEKTTEQMLEDVVPAQGCPLSEFPAVGIITHSKGAKP